MKKRSLSYANYKLMTGIIDDVDKFASAVLDKTFYVNRDTLVKAYFDSPDHMNASFVEHLHAMIFAVLKSIADKCKDNEIIVEPNGEGVYQMTVKDTDKIPKRLLNFIIKKD